MASLEGKQFAQNINWQKQKNKTLVCIDTRTYINTIAKIMPGYGIIKHINIK